VAPHREGRAGYLAAAPSRTRKSDVAVRVNSARANSASATSSATSSGVLEDAWYRTRTGYGRIALDWRFDDALRDFVRALLDAQYPHSAISAP
jgi:hypothetical protein